MRILGLIPARGGSKGVPKKNVKLLNNKPLIQYTSEPALASKYLDRVVVSTDDDAIVNVARQIGLEVPFKRPLNLAQDSTPTLPVVQHALAFYKTQGISFDAVCLLQVTSLFKTTKFIDTAIKKFIKSDADALISVQKVPDEYNPHWIFKPDTNGFIKLFTGEKEIISRRQGLPEVYYRDGLIYITKTEVLLEQNSLYGSKIAYIESPSNSTINIDTPEDWAKAETFLNSKNN